MTDKISISLYELAYGCHLYGAMTGFDRALSKVRRALHPEPDLLKPEHRHATLEFLRAWGCQHLALADTELSSDALQSWTRAHAADLPKPGRSVEMLSDGELAAVARAYANLATKKASQHAQFGPVAAAKTLFLLQPYTCPPWDNAIREYLSCDVSAAGYQRYLGEVGRFVRVLADEAGVSVAELPQVVERPESSAAEVVDEYLWVRCSQNWKPPSLEMLGRWAAWARRNHPD
jgi:hypothetical protein